MQLFFPFQLDGRGRVAETGYSEHVRHLIEQILFTAPGERVNRPEFGCGLLDALFGPGSPEETVALRFLVQESLQRWLGELVQIVAVDLEHVEERLLVTVRYVEKERQQQREATFEVAPR